jgi:hypothetical protein
MARPEPNSPASGSRSFTRVTSLLTVYPAPERRLLRHLNRQCQGHLYRPALACPGLLTRGLIVGELADEGACAERAAQWEPAQQKVAGLRAVAYVIRWSL